MANVPYCICSFCKSVGQSEAYKLKQSNFSNVRVEVFATNSQPVHYNAVICKECLNKVPSPIKPIIDIMETAKTNDAEVTSGINS